MMAEHRTFETGGTCVLQDGMSMEDYFTAAALTGLLSNPKVVEQIDSLGPAVRNNLAQLARAFGDSTCREENR